MMVKSKNKSLLIAVLALITCCVFAIAGIGATNAAAWYEWNKHPTDGPIITPEQLADSSWDGNGWRTTVEASAWKFGVADYKGINATTGFTEVTLQNQAQLRRGFSARHSHSFVIPPTLLIAFCDSTKAVMQSTSFIFSS